MAALSRFDCGYGDRLPDSYERSERREGAEVSYPEQPVVRRRCLGLLYFRDRPDQDSDAQRDGFGGGRSDRLGDERLRTNALGRTTKSCDASLQLARRAHGGGRSLA